MKSIKPRQIVDTKAALLSGLISGFIYLIILGFIVPIFVGGNFWVINRMWAAILMGPTILAPPSTFDSAAFFLGLGVHFVLSILYAGILALIIHRWGLLTGIVLGGIFGFCLYLINVYSLTLLYPWFMVMKHSSFLVSHIIFGMLSGGIYELLEVEKFETNEVERV